MFPRWLVIVLIMATAAITANVMASGLPGSVGTRDGATPSGAPAIVWGTPIGHGDRGACTSCHNVVSSQRAPLPAISALSAMPHEYRGVCNNCHRIQVSWFSGILDRIFE